MSLQTTPRDKAVNSRCRQTAKILRGLPNFQCGGLYIFLFHIAECRPTCSLFSLLVRDSARNRCYGALMPRPSKSLSPVAQLRRLLGADMTARIFAKRHNIALDQLKKIESERAPETLSFEKAQELAVCYGLRVDSLTQKVGSLIGIDGKKAQSTTIHEWQKVRDTMPKMAKSLASASIRHLWSLFLASGETGETARLAVEFETWRTRQLQLSQRLRMALEDYVSRPQRVFEGKKTVSELGKILGSNPIWGRECETMSGSYPVKIVVQKLLRPIIAFQSSGPSEAVYLVCGPRVRRKTVYLRRAKRLLKMSVETGIFDMLYPVEQSSFRPVRSTRVHYCDAVSSPEPVVGQSP